MRSFSEEFKAGTIEYLATLPIKDYEIVWGKYLASLGWLAMLIAFTLPYTIILFIIGRPDIGQLVASYIAIIGLGALFTAIGVWASALTRNQVVAFIVSFFICFLLFMLDRAAEFIPAPLGTFIREMGVNAHFETMARGVLDTRDLFYWLSGTVFFLTAALAVMNSRRWR
jgi:ABC-2 type transport system permease protein